MIDFKEENAGLKSHIQELRTELANKDKDRILWREKCKNAESKGQQINLKIVELEQELRMLILERDTKNLRSGSASPDFGSKPEERKSNRSSMDAGHAYFN